MAEDAFPDSGDPLPTNAALNSPAPVDPVSKKRSETLDSDDDFYDRKLAQQSHIESPQRVEADLPPRQCSISVQQDVNVEREDRSADEESNKPSSRAEATGPIHEHTHSEEEGVMIVDEDAAVFKPQESVKEQERELDEHMPDLPSEQPNEQVQDAGPGVEAADKALSSDDLETQHKHAENYDFQGEATEMEEAIEPSAEAPLMEDEEPLPTPGQVSREPTMSMDPGFDGTPAPGQPRPKSPPAHPQLDRSFTSNFTEEPQEQPEQAQAQSHGQAIPDDWPEVGDDKTFGELLDDERPPRIEQEGRNELAPKETEQQAASHEPEEASVDKEEDLAAAWGAALDDDDDDDMLEETPTSGFDPSAAFGDDEDGFLEDEELAPVQPAANASSEHRGRAPANPYQPTGISQAPQAQGLDQFHGRSAGTPQTGLDNLYGQNEPAQRPGLQHAQSFVDKAKGGYQSPYDLPMDVVKPRRRPQQVQQPAPAQTPAAPPRTSSYTTVPEQPKPPPRSSSYTTQPPVMQPPNSRPQPPMAASVASMSPPPSSYSGGSIAPPQGASEPSKGRPQGGSGFFEDLPVTMKARPRPAGAYTPQPSGMPMSPPGPMGPPQQMPPRGPSAPPTQQPQHPVAPPQPQTAYGGLQQPGRMPLLPDRPEPPAQPAAPAQAPPQSSRYSPNSQAGSMAAPSAPVASRYSPAPAAAAAAAAAAPSRYSPALPAQPGDQTRGRYSSTGTFSPPAAGNPFAPRTSSPLAAANVDKPHPPLPQQGLQPMPFTPPRNPSLQRTATQPDGMVSRYPPSEMRVPDTDFGAPLPQRPRTQSPDTTMKSPTNMMTPMQRPTSAGQGAQPSKGPVLPHRRQFSRELSFAPPQDERNMDPMERWKGHPIFHWNASGTVLTSFPKQTPFYAAGQAVPSLKCTSGSINIQDANSFMPMDDRNAKFPGPLPIKAKGKKKEVLAWLVGKLEDLERQTEGAMLDFNQPPEVKKRTEEKLVLWRVMKVFVEHDGALEGNSKIEEEIRRILLPNLAQMSQLAEMQSPTSAVIAGDAVDKQVLLQIRQALLEGQRERAVWLAEEKKLWGHAMLIASTMGPETWKQIAQSFVRSQVKTVGSDSRSLAALYQVFAGNSEECADELVPPSARAGFRMISKSDGSAASNPLEGLDQWRETLGMVTSCRTPQDGASLISLGKMLTQYGRVEAGHACFLFARNFVKHGGVDNKEAHFALLGANHQDPNEAVGNDLDSILLTEIYEFACSLSTSSTSATYVPQLQSFKLIHAQHLAAYGLKSKAQAYCDHITAAYTSTTRPSPYYHPVFTQAVSDLSAFLSRSPQDGKGGFFSKPAMNKVSSGAASWFTKFVSGDDGEEAQTSGGMGEGAHGPFGGANNGGMSTMSRSESQADLYGSQMMGGVPPMGVPAQSVPPQSFTPSSASSGRYAPSKHAQALPHSGGGAGSKYAPVNQGGYGAAAMPSSEPQRPGSARYATAQNRAMLGVPRPEAARSSASDYGIPYSPAGSRRGSAQDTASSQGSYEPRPILSDDASNYSYSPSMAAQMSPAPAVQEPGDAFASTNGIPDQTPLDPEGGGAGGYMPPTSSYEPPTSTYQPYEPSPPSPEDPTPKKKAFPTDDDYEADDLARRAAALNLSATAHSSAKPTPSNADAETDAAFRAAAEADAARDAASKSAPKKGWLGSIFGSSPKEAGGLSAPSKRDSSAGGGPIRAKLGEENSFYYDEQLKKWVNKKAGPGDATPAAATPPPPMGAAKRVGSMGPPPPGSRSASGASGMGPPSSGGSRPGTAGSMAGPPSFAAGLPSRSGTPASEAGAGGAEGGAAGGLLPPGAAGAGGSAGAMQPPPRPASTLSTASSIDDLLGGPTGARKVGGSSVKGKKRGGRYVDVMAK